MYASLKTYGMLTICGYYLKNRKDDPRSVSCVLQSKVLSYLCPCLTSGELPFIVAIVHGV